MKKIIVFLAICIVLAVAFSYIFIPYTIKVKVASEGTMNTNAVERYLVHENNWHKWWPGPKAFSYDQLNFILDKKTLNGFKFRMLFKSDTFNSVMELVPLSNNSTGYVWTCEFESSKNPFMRWEQYFNALQIKNNLDTLTGKLRDFMNKTENVYGFQVKKVKVVDSVLISTRKTFLHYPDEKEIDTMIRQLKSYILSQHSIEKNYPMLNVHLNGENDYEAMVAIATERLLPATTDFAPKRVLKNGNILEAQVVGGPETVRSAFDQFENYKVDNEISAPAIPYQLLITDRVKETDTTKWVTKFYYPVF